MYTMRMLDGATGHHGITHNHTHMTMQTGKQLILLNLKESEQKQSRWVGFEPAYFRVTRPDCWPFGHVDERFPILRFHSDKKPVW